MSENLITYGGSPARARSWLTKIDWQGNFSPESAHAFGNTHDPRIAYAAALGMPAISPEVMSLVDEHRQFEQKLAAARNGLSLIEWGADARFGIVGHEDVKTVTALKKSFSLAVIYDQNEAGAKWTTRFEFPMRRTVHDPWYEDYDVLNGWSTVIPIASSEISDNSMRSTVLRPSEITIETEIGEMIHACYGHPHLRSSDIGHLLLDVVRGSRYDLSESQ